MFTATASQNERPGGDPWLWFSIPYSCIYSPTPEASIIFLNSSSARHLTPKVSCIAESVLHWGGGKGGEAAGNETLTRSVSMK